ncbi:unnamed protein product [Symbiodinium sp. CCMP2592]|nr:unnamed protein product [Symbiodinium sp. CCMP2592]
MWLEILKFLPADSSGIRQSWESGPCFLQAEAVEMCKTRAASRSFVDAKEPLRFIRGDPWDHSETQRFAREDLAAHLLHVADLTRTDTLLVDCAATHQKSPNGYPGEHHLLEVQLDETMRARRDCLKCLHRLSDVWFEHAPMSMHIMIRDLVRMAEFNPDEEWGLFTSSYAFVLLREIVVRKEGFQNWLTAQPVSGSPAILATRKCHPPRTLSLIKPGKVRNYRSM